MTIEDLIASLPMPCAVIASDGAFAAANAGFVGLFGSDMRGRHFVSVLRQPQLVAQIEAAMAAGTMTKGRHIGLQAGRETIHAVTLSPVKDDGKSNLWLAVFEDITPVEEAHERRSEFVANVSHELRTPLTAIMGFIETLRGPARDDAAARAQFLEIMAQEAGRMTRLVDDLLVLARVEDVERMRPGARVDLAVVIGEVIAALAPRAAAREVKVIYQGPSEALVELADRDQLGQVFTNIIENAIKYGREGGQVQVEVEAVERAELIQGPGFRVAVRDEGDGIDVKHLGRLTERFYRVDSHRSRTVGGTGLGLAIVKHIVSRHRGFLRIESTRGVGSVFTVFLPRG